MRRFPQIFRKAVFVVEKMRARAENRCCAGKHAPRAPPDGQMNLPAARGRWKILRAASIAREAQRERFEKVRAGDEGGFVEVEIVRLKRGAWADSQKEEEPGQMALIP